MIKTIANNTLIGLLGLASSTPAFAADDTRLGLVWGRVADFKGEFGSVESAEFSPDGRYIVAATKFDFQIVKFRVSDGAELWRIQARDEVEHAQFSPDGKHIVAGGEDATTRVYDAETGKELAAYFHTQSVDSVTWSPDGRYIFTGEEDYKVKGKNQGHGRLFSWPGLELIASTDNHFTHNGVAFSPDSRLVATSTRDGVHIWDVEKKLKLVRKVETLTSEGRRVPPIAVNWSADGKYLVAGSKLGDIFIWDTENYKLIRTMSQTGRKIETVDFSPDGRYLAHAGHTTDIWMWKMKDLLNNEIPTERLEPAHRAFANANAEDLNFTNDGYWLVSAHQDGVVRLWVVMNDDPETATKANSVLLQNQAEKNWGEINAREHHGKR